MDFKASNSTGSGDSYEKPAPGTYTGVLQGFAGCGTHADGFNKGKTKKRCMLRWELHKRRGPSVDSQGRIHTVTLAFTASMHEKAKLRQIVEAHIGVLRNDDRTSSEQWLGKPVKLTLRDSDDGKYANVFSASPFDAEEEECQPPAPKLRRALGDRQGRPQRRVLPPLGRVAGQQVQGVGRRRGRGPREALQPRTARALDGSQPLKAVGRDRRRRG